MATYPLGKKAFQAAPTPWRVNVSERDIEVLAANSHKVASFLMLGQDYRLQIALAEIVVKAVNDGMILTKPETNTILAALRCLQHKGNRHDSFGNLMWEEIETDGGTEPLTDDEIEALAMKINCGG